MKQLTLRVRQTNWSNEVSDWHTIVQAQNRNILVKVGETEILDESSQHESRFRANIFFATIVLSEGDTDHEPEESGR